MELDSPRSEVMKDDPMKYAGFWLRFCSMLLDSLILSPLLFLMMLDMSRLLMIGIVTLLFFFEAFYEVYFVQRFGGTPGKLIVGLRILKTNGSPVTYREALLRAGPELIFSLFGSIGLVVALSRIPGAAHSTFLAGISSSQLLAFSPAWSGPVTIIERIWNWGELIVLQTNRKKRALHDFIAGTVVVQHSKPAGSPAIRPMLSSSEGV